MSKKEILYHLKRNYPKVLAAQRKVQIKKVMKVFLIDAVLVILGYLSKDDFNNRGFGTAFMISVVILCLFMAFWCKPRFVIFAPIRHGKIVKLDVVTIQGAKDAKFMVTLLDAEKKHNMLKILVENEKGSSFVMMLSPKCGSTMRLGDEIFKLPALENPIVVTGGNPKHICPICGNIAPSSEEECIGCGNKFVKFD